MDYDSQVGEVNFCGQEKCSDQHMEYGSQVKVLKYPSDY